MIALANQRPEYDRQSEVVFFNAECIHKQDGWVIYFTLKAMIISADGYIYICMYFINSSLDHLHMFFSTGKPQWLDEKIKDVWITNKNGCESVCT